VLHPGIRLLTFACFSGFVAAGSSAGLAAGALLLAAAHGMARQWPGRSAWRLVRRLRWVLLSIAILYLWFTPGHLLFSAAWAPTQEGLILAAERVIALVILALAANLLLQATTREALLAGLFWLATPLKAVGLSRDRLAVRALLTLEAVTATEPLLRTSLAAGPRPANPWQRIVTTLDQALSLAESRAAAAPCGPVEVPWFGAPRLPQWLWPVAVASLFLLLV